MPQLTMHPDLLNHSTKSVIASTHDGRSPVPLPPDARGSAHLLLRRCTGLEVRSARRALPSANTFGHHGQASNELESPCSAHVFALLRGVVAGPALPRRRTTRRQSRALPAGTPAPLSRHSRKEGVHVGNMGFPRVYGGGGL